MLGGLALLALLQAHGAVDPVIDGAFRDAQMALASPTALSLARAAARLSAGDADLRVRLSSRARAEAALAQAEQADARARAAGVGQATAAVEAARVALAAAERDLSTDGAGLRPLGVAAAQALLGTGEAILLVQPTAAGTFLFAVTPGRVDWRRSDLTDAALAREVAALRRALDPGGVARSGEDAVPDAGRATGFPLARAHALYRQLWAPVAPALKGAHTVYVMAGGALGALPLALLPVRPAGRLDRADWLVRHHATVTIPSVASLGGLRGRAPASGGRGFAGFGAPLPNPRAAALPPLPGTAGEMARMAALLGGTAATGAAATEAAVAGADLSTASVIGFATHAVVAGEAGIAAEPALILSPPVPGEAGDGLLTASEAARLQLDADWVVLSACNTAAGDPAAGGEGLSGLARGFFAAGARAVLASHWRVRDDAVDALTVETIRRWLRDPAAGRAAALRGAMLAMLHDRRHPERADPSWWAPLVVAGEGR